MKVLISFLLTILISFNLIGQIKNYDSKGKPFKSNERIHLKIDKESQKSNAYSAKESVGTIGAAILPTVIDGGIKIFKNVLKKREAKFTGQYSASSSESGFWALSDQLDLPKLTLTRQLTKNNETACKIVLFPEQSSDGSAFRYRLESLNLYKSKAKVKPKFNELNFKIDIKFIAIEQGNDKFTKTDKGENSIEFNGVKFKENKNLKEYYSGWFPMMVNPKKDKEAGNYEIKVSVTEINPAKIRPQRVREFLESNGESINSISKIVVENIFKSEEEEETPAADENTPGNQ